MDKSEKDRIRDICYENYLQQVEEMDCNQLCDFYNLFPNELEEILENQGELESLIHNWFNNHFFSLPPHEQKRLSEQGFLSLL